LAFTWTKEIVQQPRQSAVSYTSRDQSRPIACYYYD